MKFFSQKRKFFILFLFLCILFSFTKSKNNQEFKKVDINTKLENDIEYNNNKYFKFEDKNNNFFLNYSISHFSYLNDFILINEAQDIIELDKGKFYKNIIYKEDEQKYIIKVSNESNIYKIFIDIMIYVGEVKVNLPNNLNVSQYTDINKLYLSIKVNGGKIDELIFSIKGLSNSSYAVSFNIGKEDEEDSLITNELETGLSYLVTIDPTKKDQLNVGNKAVIFNFYNNNDKNKIMFSFYSLNCKTKVGRFYSNDEGIPILDDNIINLFDHFSQDIVDLREENNVDKLEYRIMITENDPSNYDGKLCKIYVSSIELTDEYNEMTKDILIPDNIPQQVMFTNKVKHVTYGYIHVDYQNDLIIKFNPKHKAQFKIILYYNYQKRDKEEIIVANDIIYLESNEWRDKFNKSNCYIQLDIILEKTKYNDDPLLEFSIESSSSNSVSYIPKNLLSIDYTQNMNSKYFYTELGKNEEGFIVVNFLRGSGKIYARIVNYNNNEKDGNWRGKYILPNKDNTLIMDSLKKKLEFSTQNLNCQKGCYLLIKVFSNVEINSIELDRIFPFSIIVHSYPIYEDFDKIPIINVPVDEYIVGSVKDMFPKDFIYEFYSVWLNSNADIVLIDFQSNSGSLFINVGNKRPSSIDKSHFAFWPNGKDSIYSIKKNDIINKTNEYKNYKSLKDIVLTIGIWTNVSDSIDTTLFSFIVRLGNDTENDIYRVNSDRKALCNSKKIKEKNTFRCLYVIEYDYISYINIPMIYPTVQNKSAILSIYSKKINQLDYEINSEDNIKGLIPNKENNDNSIDKPFNNFLMISSGLENKEYILISVETDIETTVGLLTTFFLYQEECSVNPNTPQLFGLFNPSILLNFPLQYMEMVNIKAIYGSVQIFWDNNPDNKYYLKGRDDRLSITSEKSGKQHKLNMTHDNNDFFIFYIDYDIRKDNFNFDELILDSSNNYIYSENDLPISYYAPLNSSNMYNNEYYDIFFTFDILESEEKITTYIQDIPFEVNAFIVKKNTILLAKSNPDIDVQKGEIISGNYDPALKAGLIRISKENIEKSGIPKYENPYLYLTIKKIGENIKKKLYKRIILGMSSIKSRPEVFVSELFYQFGKLDKTEKERKYRLRPDNSFNYMNLKFSCANNALFIKIEGNYNIKEEKEEYGRKIYSVKINPEDISLILVILRNNNNSQTEEFFMFQYSHSNKAYNKEYSISNTTIEIEKKDMNIEKDKKKANYRISLMPVDNYQNYNITYILRGIEKSKNMPKKACLSLQFNDNQYIKEYYNPTIDEKKKRLLFDFMDIPDSLEYIQIIAKIKDKEKIEYLSYDVNISSSEINRENNNNKYLILIIIIISFLFIIIIVLIIVVILFCNKNKGLLDKVNKISFSLDIGNEHDNENKED